MTYAAIGEGRTQHNAAMQVITLGSEHRRLAWITDLVTKQVAAVSDELMKRRASTMKQTLQAQATHSELEAANGYGQRENSTKREEPYVSIPSCSSGRGNTRRHAIEVRLRGDEVRIFSVGVPRLKAFCGSHKRNTMEKRGQNLWGSL